MSPDATFDVILACGVAGVAALAAGAVAQVATVVTQRRHTHDEPAVLLVEPSAVEWFACHDLRCAHTTTPHYPTPVGGLACDYCGTVRTETS